MALDFKQWLKAKGLKSNPKNADLYRQSGHYRPPRPTARAPKPQEPPFSYARAVNRDPLSLPYGSEEVWRGTKAPNLQTLQERGTHRFLTPIQENGKWYAYGTPEDVTPDWAKDQLQWFSDRSQKHQNYAMGTVAPWLANQLGALQSAGAQAQAGFANLINQVNAGANAGSAQVGPGEGFDALQSSDAVDRSLAQDAASAGFGAQTAGAAYQAAVDQLGSQSAAQGLQASFADAVSRIPDRYDEQRQQFLNQLAPVLMEIRQRQDDMETQRRGALEERRRWGLEFNEARNQARQQGEVERHIAGMEAMDRAADRDVDLLRIQSQNQRAAASNAAADTRNRRTVAAQNARAENNRRDVAARTQTPQQKRLQAALTDARRFVRGQTVPQNPDIPAQGTRTIKYSQREIAQQLVQEHGVPYAWALSVAKRLGYGTKDSGEGRDRLRDLTRFW